MVDASGQNSLADFSPHVKVPYSDDERADPDGLPLRGKQMLNKLIDTIHDYAKDRRRVRQLVTFEKRTNEKGGEREISRVGYWDRPEIELYIKHRNDVLILDFSINKIQETLNANTFSPEDITAISANLVELNRKKQWNIEAMEKILATLAKEQVSREAIIAKIASDAAKLVQSAVQHRDKMELASKVARIPTQNDLKAQLAEKYNVPIEQVDKIMGAKSADVISDG